MLGLKYNGKFLVLKPGTSSEIERKSPLFAMNESASEVTTIPLSFPYKDNAVILGFPFNYYTERKKIKLKVEYHDGGRFVGFATLVLQTGSLNLNNIEDAEMSGDLMYGISDFFQDIKDKYLNKMPIGGTRSFAWTTNDPTDGSNGFWQHIHETWVNDSIPYIFQPISTFC